MRMVDCQLKVESLSHCIGKQIILNGINLNIKGNQVVTLLGPNGAGKSTLLKSIAGQLFCQKGSVEFDGSALQNERMAYMDKIGYMPENAVFLPELLVIEQLRLMASLKKIKNSDAKIMNVLDLCHLNAVKNKYTRSLSLGYKQRLNLAQALLNNPRLIIMDEPLNGLDPHLIIEFREIIKRLKKNALIVISTHYLAEAELISDRVVIMKHGSLLKNETVNNLKTHGLESVYLQLTLQEDS